MLLLVSFTGFSQIITTTYRGAFAPAPEAMWTDTWTEYDPQNKVYPTRIALRDEMVDWSVEMKDYHPPDFTADNVLKK